MRRGRRQSEKMVDTNSSDFWFRVALGLAALYVALLGYFGNRYLSKFEKGIQEHGDRLLRLEEWRKGLE